MSWANPVTSAPMTVRKRKKTTPYRVLGFKIRDTKTGLYAGPGVIGSGRWTPVGRTWTRQSDLSGSIGVWLERINRWPSAKNNMQRALDWEILLLTDRGAGRSSFMDWVIAKEDGKPMPLPTIGTFTLTFTADEIDRVEEALIEGIGDSDDAGALVMKVVEALKHFSE